MSAANADNRLNHLPVLDGLRGIAILLVMGRHFTQFPDVNAFWKVISWVQIFGWCGVDLFFVVSGFLITRILLNSKESPSYFRAFYARRFLRIFPLYYLTLFFFLVLAPGLGWFQSYGEHGHFFTAPPATVDQWAYWLYLSNWWIHTCQHHAILLITWSLAIEEQFYIIWPWLARKISTRQLQWICVGLLCVCPVIRIVMHSANVNPAVIYMWTICRLDCIAAGALQATLLAQGQHAVIARWAKPAAALSGLALLVCVARTLWDRPTFDSWNHPWVQTIGYSGFAIFFASIAGWLLVTERNALHKILLFPPLMLFGKWCYCLYLIHLLIQFVLGDRVLEWVGQYLSTGIAPLAYFLILSLVCLTVSGVSWYVFESPLLRLKRHFPYQTSIPST